VVKHAPFLLTTAISLLGCGARSDLDVTPASNATGLPDAAPAERDAAPRGRDGAVVCPGPSGQGPVVLASGLDSPGPIAVDAAYVYWLEEGFEGPHGLVNGSVKRVSICGGAVDTLASGQSAPDSIAVDAAYVYWLNAAETEQSTVMRVAKAGGAPEILTAALGGADCLALGSAALYAGGTGIGAVASVPFCGGTPTPLVPGDILVSSIIVDSTRAYWLSLENGEAAGALLATPITANGGGPVTTLATGLNGPTSLAVDARDLYWLEAGDEGGDNVVRMPLAGGPTTVVASNAQAFAVDGAQLFWIRWSGVIGDVLQTPIDGGGASAVLASGQRYANAIAVDGSSVYWSNSPGDMGAIMKVAK
jgi:hypothetical protein